MTTAEHMNLIFRERATRMKRLIELNAPANIICLEARNILTAETQNSKWLAIWKWATDEWRSAWQGFKCDLHIWRLKRQGWSHACALNIYFGEKPEQHKKRGCNCDEEFERQLLEALRREEAI